MKIGMKCKKQPFTSAIFESSLKEFEQKIFAGDCDNISHSSICHQGNLTEKKQS